MPSEMNLTRVGRILPASSAVSKLQHRWLWANGIGTKCPPSCSEIFEILRVCSEKKKTKNQQQNNLGNVRSKELGRYEQTVLAVS